MSGWWTLALTPVMAASLFLVLIVVEACKDAVKEEARTRMERFPFALLHLAARRLPVEVRIEVLHEEWLPELHYIIRETGGLPITRLIRSSWYSLDLARGGRRVGSDLKSVRREPVKTKNRNLPSWYVRLTVSPDNMTLSGLLEVPRISGALDEASPVEPHLRATAEEWPASHRGRLLDHIIDACSPQDSD